MPRHSFYYDKVKIIREGEIIYARQQKFRLSIQLRCKWYFCFIINQQWFSLVDVLRCPCCGIDSKFSSLVVNDNLVLMNGFLWYVVLLRINLVPWFDPGNRKEWWSILDCWKSKCREAKIWQSETCYQVILMLSWHLAHRLVIISLSFLFLRLHAHLRSILHA